MCIYLVISLFARTKPDLHQSATLVASWLGRISILDVAFKVYQAEPSQPGILKDQQAVIVIGSGVLLWLAVAGIWIALSSPFKKKALKAVQASEEYESS